MNVPVARLVDVGLRYGRTRALDHVTLDVPSGQITGVIGPDGVGKSSLLSALVGVRAIDDGTIAVLGGDLAVRRHRERTFQRIAYMPQGLGKNLYPTLSVRENVDFFGRLFGHGPRERARRIDQLLTSTSLAPYATRRAGDLSGGMKQKLALCCALIHDPDVLVLDEPTTGVDPLSRRRFWELIEDIRHERPTLSVVVATAYMEEAMRFDWLIAMDAGRVLATGAPSELLERTATTTLDAAFIALLPEERRRGHAPIRLPPRRRREGAAPIIEADHLTMRFGAFTAVDDVSLRIERGEIFGFLGSNGCGKTTTMKMLTGLLPPTSGSARLLGTSVDSADIAVRRRVGYMSQAFSLYTELTVEQNLDLHARIFGLPRAEIPARIATTARRFELEDVLDRLPEALPLGVRQRLSLAVAMIHGPEVLILDEPTSGVDPIARDRFWQLLGDLARNEDVTIFVSTHFMNEAALCDRISLMHAGRVLVSDVPSAIVAQRGAKTLEDAFVACLEEVTPRAATRPSRLIDPTSRAPKHRRFDLRRLLAYSLREALELARDPIRATLAIAGTLLLMIVIGYGINMDVDDLSFAVLDRDDTALSRDYALDLSGSRYFTAQTPILDHADLDRRMRDGKVSLVIELPPGFERDALHGRDVEVGAWIDGSMPVRAATVLGYVQGMHARWLAHRAEARLATTAPPFQLAVRYRYNPGVESLIAMVPAVIPLLLLMIPAMLAALGVVREKELGSIINFYATPVTRTELILGKQLPYIVIGIVNFVILTAFAIFIFRVPFTGSILAFAAAACLYVVSTTALGLVISAFMKSQIAAVFGTMLLTLIPATQYSGLIDPVSSLNGTGALVGRLYPATYFVTISRGTFSKGLGLHDLWGDILPLLITAPVLLVLGILLVRKQAR